MDTEQANRVRGKASLSEESQLADSVAEAARNLGISRAQLYIEHREGRIEFRYLGRRTLVARAAQQAWLEALPTKRDAA